MAAIISCCFIVYHCIVFFYDFDHYVFYILTGHRQNPRQAGAHGILRFCRNPG